MMAVLAVHDKKATDEKFQEFFSIIIIIIIIIIIRESDDNRNFVKKAVNWALRGIGKRNIVLNKMAIETAMEIKKLDFKSAKWISSNALRELESEKVQNRLNNLK